MFKSSGEVKVEVVRFNGRNYRRYPNSKRKEHRRYFGRSRGFLHRDVWEFHNGPIPEGFDVHHKDGNTENNDIGNLEVMSRADHLKEHADDMARWNYSQECINHLASIRSKASQWHGSEEGKAWHREHAKNSIGKAVRGEYWKRKPEMEKQCAFCGKSFITKNQRAVYCSNTCVCAVYRKSKQEANPPKPRECTNCKKEYVSKFKVQLYCSTVCKARKNREDRKNASLQPEC